MSSLSPEKQTQVTDIIAKAITLANPTEGVKQGLFVGAIGEDGKIHQQGRDYASNILKNALASKVSLVDLEFYSGLHFDQLIKDHPNDIKAIRKVLTSLKLQIAYESARRIVNSETGRAIARDNGLSRSPRKNVIGYANELVTAHNREANALKMAQRQRLGLPETPPFESKADVRRQKQVDRLKLADEIRSRTEQAIERRLDEVAANNDLLAAEVLPHEQESAEQYPAITMDENSVNNGFNWLVKLRQGLRSKISGINARTVITGLSLAFVLLVTNRASSQINGINQDYNNWIARQPQPINALTLTQEGETADFIAKLVEEAITDSVATDNEAIPANELAKNTAPETLKGEAETVSDAQPDAEVVENVVVTGQGYQTNVSGTEVKKEVVEANFETTDIIHNLSAEQTDDLATRPTTPSIVVDAIMVDAEATFVSQADLELQKIEDFKVRSIENGATIANEKSDGSFDLRIPLSELKLAPGEDYWKKGDNSKTAAEQFYKRMKEIVKFIAGQVYAFIDNGFIDVTYEAGYRHTGVLDSKTGRVSLYEFGSGLCWIISAIGESIDQANEWARSIDMPNVFVFPKADGSTTDNNNNPRHRTAYGTYGGFGYTVAQGDNGKAVTDQKIIANEEFERQLNELGLTADIEIVTGFTYGNPSEGEIDFVPEGYAEVFVNEGVDTSYAMVVMHVRPLEEFVVDTSGVVADSIFINSGGNIAGNPKPNFTTTTTEAETIVNLLTGAELVMAEP